MKQFCTWIYAHSESAGCLCFRQYFVVLVNKYLEEGRVLTREREGASWVLTEASSTKTSERGREIDRTMFQQVSVYFCLVLFQDCLGKIYYPINNPSHLYSSSLRRREVRKPNSFISASMWSVSIKHRWLTFSLSLSFISLVSYS